MRVIVMVAASQKQRRPEGGVEHDAVSEFAGSKRADRGSTGCPVGMLSIRRNWAQPADRSRWR
jgi:hypothetical protein